MVSDDTTQTETVLLAHGSGGRLSHRLVEEIFLPVFRNQALDLLEDSSPFQVTSNQLVITTDSYVVEPVVFPGGDIGKLAVCGTVNDLATAGAEPAALTAGFILEEGLPLRTLQVIVNSMRQAADEAGVRIIAGDTKVVPRGKADLIFINTTGVGVLHHGRLISPRCMKCGDVVLINGPIGDHGIAVMAAREGLTLPQSIRSDCAPLAGMVQAILSAGLTIHAMRDPTRGGLATTLNEIAAAAAVEMEIDEDQVPIRPEVQSACEILGFDPFYLANEGKMIIILPADQAEAALSILRQHSYGGHSRQIGRITRPGKGRVFLKTEIGGSRLLDMLTGEQLPRIC